MQQLVKTQQETSTWSDDDPQISYMISAWARICQILGDEFHQYLPTVMGPLLKAASFKPQGLFIKLPIANTYFFLIRDLRAYWTAEGSA